VLYNHQRTIATEIQCTGKGLHSGQDVSLRLIPAEPGHGILFKRVDVVDQPNIVPASYDKVVDTRFCTTLENEAGVTVATVEHLMAALAGLGIDNLTIELDAAEVPIMDGSSEPFVFLLECAGIRKQQAQRRYLRLNRSISIQQDSSWIALYPADSFSMEQTIEFSNAVIGCQTADVDFSAANFKNSLCRARTFGFEEDVTRLRDAGLALGGSLENAIVVGDAAILNHGGLRYSDEFVRHKMLDCLGDLYLEGAQVLAHVEGCRVGHGINNAVLHQLFEDDSAWEWTALEEVGRKAQPRSSTQTSSLMLSAR